MTQDNKKQLITLLTELNLLLDLFLFDNINKTQLRQFINLNLNNLFDRALN